MTYLRAHCRTIILALTIAAAFAAIDLYLINISSYVCGLLLAGVLLERKKVKPFKECVSLEKPKCPGCGGRIRKIAAKRPGGIEQYRCCSCKRKFEEKNGQLRQVAV